MDFIYNSAKDYLQATEARLGVAAAVADANKLLQSTTCMEVLLAAREYMQGVERTVAQ